MTRLVIYRGETQIAEVPLTGKTMKLGRGKDNDVVLDDPGKGVSRVHAELRPEGGRYRLVDLQSQNGTWVSGERVPSVLLAPGVVAAMGPFRVAIDASSPLTQSFPVVREESIPDTGTEFNRPLPALPPSPEPEPVAVGRLATPLADPVPEDGGHPAAQPPDSTPAAVAAPAHEAPVGSAAAAAARRPAASPAAGGGSRMVMLAVVAVLVMAASAFGAYQLLLRKAKPQPVWDAAAAAALADSGRCREALDQQINRALAVEPNNPEALKLKAKCTAPPPVPATTTVPPPVVVAQTNTDKLDAAEAALKTSACQAALDTATEVLAADATDERAHALLKKATDCLNPPATRPRAITTVDPAIRVAPAQGGLEPLQGETAKDYKARMAAVRKRYDDAVGLLQGQRYQQALRELDAVAGQVPPGYLELAQRRAEARSGIGEESNRAYAAAQQAEQQSEWKSAIAQYQRAHDLSPARDVSADLARIADAKAGVGRQLCRDAEAAYALGHNGDAIDKFTRVLDLLPSSDDCYVKAKDRLAKLGR